MLTNAAVKAARPRTAAYKLFDQGGLHLYVVPTGRKSFRMRFRFGGKEQLLTIGAVPEVTLDAARIRCNQVREQLDRGEDPRAPALAAMVAPSTFEPAARAWHAHRLADWTPVHAVDVIASLERDIFPMLGGTPLADIRPPLILQVLRTIERRGSVESARRLQQRISRVFKYACSEGWADDVLRAARRDLHSHAADLEGAALIFPGRANAAIGEGAIRILYQRAGFGDRHVPHGWRASFSTILNEQLPDERAVIDRALGHVGGGKDEEEQGINRKVEGAYNRSTHMPRRRQLFDAWAEVLTGAAPIAAAAAAAA